MTDSHDKTTEDRPASLAGRDFETQVCRLFAQDVFLAQVLATLQRTTVARVVSPIIRDTLRTAVAEHGIDPGPAWENARLYGESDPQTRTCDAAARMLRALGLVSDALHGYRRKLAEVGCEPWIDPAVDAAVDKAIADATGL